MGVSAPSDRPSLIRPSTHVLFVRARPCMDDGTGATMPEVGHYAPPNKSVSDAKSLFEAKAAPTTPRTRNFTVPKKVTAHPLACHAYTALLQQLAVWAAVGDELLLVLFAQARAGTTEDKDKVGASAEKGSDLCS